MSYTKQFKKDSLTYQYSEFEIAFINARCQRGIPVNKAIQILRKVVPFPQGKFFNENGKEV